MIQTNIVTHTIDLNVSQPNNFEYVYTTQGDYGSDKIIANLYDQNVPYEIDCDMIFLQGVTQYGDLIEINKGLEISKDRHSVTFTLTKDMLSSAGDIQYTLSFIDTTGRCKKTTFPFTIKNTIEPSGTISSSTLTAITDYVLEAKQYAEDAKQSVDNKLDKSVFNNQIGNHTVKSDVPENAKFTDTVYDDTEVQKRISDNGYGEVAGGKNLVNPKNIQKGKVIQFTDGTIVNNQDYFISGFISVSPGKTYTKSGFTNTAEHFYYDSAKNPIKVIRTETFTAPDNAAYVILSGKMSDGFNCQLEEGTTATDYEPYFPSNKMLEEENYQQYTEIMDKIDTAVTVSNSITFEKNGAKGDGTTDDTEAIKATIEEAETSGKTILIGKATYLFTERLIINKSVNMIGAGADESVLKFRSTETHEESQYDTEWWEGSNAAIAVKADCCVFSNFTITGGENENSASAYNGIIFHYPYKYTNYWGYEAAQRISMSQCVIQGFKNGLYMFGGWNRYFNGCYFKQCADSGVKYEPLEVARLGQYTSSGDIFEACQITGCKNYGIDISYVYENYFVNCVMEYNGRAIRAINCRDLTFKTCWNEANYNNIQVTGNVRFEGGFNISNTTVEHTLNAANDVIVFTENGDTTICRQQKIIYRQVGGVVVKGVEIGAELENNILNPYWEEEVGGSKVQVSTAHWNPYTGVYCTISTEEKYKGRNSAKIDVSGLTTDQDFGWRTEKILINDGTTYTLSFAAKVNDFQAINDAGGMTVYVQWLNSSGVATLNANQAITFSSNEWEEKSIVLTPNSNSAYVIVGFGFKRNGTAYVSCPSLTDNSSAISSDVRVTQGSGTSGKVVYFRSADGNMIGSIDLDKYKDGDSLTLAVAEMTKQMKLINNELYGTDIVLESENSKVNLTPKYENGSISSCTIGDTLIIRTNNLFDYSVYTQHTDVYEGYRGINLADIVYIKPSTKYTCSTSATSGNTLYFGTNLDTGVDENGGHLTATSDSNGNLYIWILADRSHYQDMIDGTITIQVEEGETYTDYVDHKYKTITLSSDPQDITMFIGCENIIEDKEGHPFVLTYSGESLETKLDTKLETDIDALIELSADITD